MNLKLTSIKKKITLFALTFMGFFTACFAQPVVNDLIVKSENIYYSNVPGAEAYFSSAEEAGNAFLKGWNARICPSGVNCQVYSNFRQCSTNDDANGWRVGAALFWGESSRYCADSYTPPYLKPDFTEAVVYVFPVCPSADYRLVSRREGGSATFSDPSIGFPYCVRVIPIVSRCQARVGNPIYPGTGTKRETDSDYRAANPLLAFVRNYDSSTGSFASQYDVDFEPATLRLVRPSQAIYSATVYLDGGSLNWGSGLLLLPKVFSKLNPSGLTATYVTPETAQVTFTKSGSLWLPNRSDFKDRLSTSGENSAPLWALSRVNEREILSFDSSGRLLRRQLASGSSVSFHYNSATGFLSGITDDFGRNIVANYIASGTRPQLQSIVDPAGGRIVYSYNSGQLLTQVLFQDMSKKYYLWDEPLHSVGESVTVAKLTGLIDELGSRYATFGYINGRAVSTQHALGTDKFTVADLRLGLPATGSVNIAYPNGATYTSVYASGNGQSLEISSNQPAGSGCAAATISKTFDAAGNVASSIDWGGHQICYANDLTTNFQNVRVEGLGSTAACSDVISAGIALPSGARKVSTLWHPDWRLEVQVAEPGKLTTSVYNGQPDPTIGGAVASCAPPSALLPDGKPIVVLCKQVEQATSDADGHLGFGAAIQSGVPSRMRSWTYNQYGQVLTERDPLGNLTTSAYYADTFFIGADPNSVGHFTGDLQSVTNALGKVTLYTQYDKHGNVLRMQDANGIETVNTYDLRQRLLSVSVAGQTTGYTYDAAGQLLRVTAPDGSWIGYEYDAAHRRVATKDDLGNRIEYSLDNAGNQTGQSVKDPAGHLARSLSRTFDALGRVQQTTGRQ